MKLHFIPEAAHELQEVAVWYEGEQPGLSDSFMNEVRRSTERAAAFPFSGAPVSGLPERWGARSFRMRTFPYRLVTALLNDECVVVAVAHASREPVYWRERLK